MKRRYSVNIGKVIRRDRMVKREAKRSTVSPRLFPWQDEVVCRIGQHPFSFFLFFFFFFFFFFFYLILF